jgi:hypothetical protein
LRDVAIVAMSHGAPAVCIMLPNEEATDAHENSANTRHSNGASVALGRRSIGAAGASVYKRAGASAA